MYSRCVKKVFNSAFVRKCTDMCKHRFGVQLLQNPPLCSSTSLSGYNMPGKSKKGHFFFVINPILHTVGLG
jgi:hypothetical protein